MTKKELLDTAKAALRRALEVSEKLLDGVPIPGVKGTIAALLQIIDEAQVCTEVQHRFISSLSLLQRTATNAELCNELKEHILRLHDQLLRPLAGKTKEEIPDHTRAAVEDYTECVTWVHLRSSV